MAVVYSTLTYNDPAWIASLTAAKIIGGLSAAQMPGLTGDVTAAAGSIATTLATVNAGAGTFGTATTVARVTVNAKGLVTAVSEVTIAGGGGGVTGSGTAGALAKWAGGSALADGPAAANVALLNAANIFSAANPIILGAPSRGTLRTDAPGYFTMQGGSTGFQWMNTASNQQVMTLTDAGALAWGGGAALTSSSDVARLSANNIFTAAAPIILGDSSRGALRTDVPGYFLLQGGSAGFRWMSSGNNVQLMTLTDAGMVTVVAAPSAGIQLGPWPISTNFAMLTLNGDSGAGANVLSAVGGSLYLNRPAGAMYFRLNSVAQWGISAAGDLTVGSADHLCDSVGVPTIVGNFGSGATIRGTDYAMEITAGSAPPGAVQIQFGHAFASPPIVVASVSLGTAEMILTIIAVTTTTVTIGCNAMQAGHRISVLVRGY